MQSGWLTVTELARMRGVAKPVLSRRLSRLEAAGAILTKPGPKGTKLVNVEAFLKAVEETEDVVRKTNGTGPKLVEDLIYSREQARNAKVSADLKELARDEQLGLLVRVQDVKDAMVRCAEALNRGISQIASRVDDGAAAVARDGRHGLLLFLRAEERRLREILAREMRMIRGSSLDIRVQD